MFTSLQTFALLRNLLPAYIDPTSGGMLLQLILGGSAAFVVLRRLVGAKVRALFRRHVDRTDHSPRS